jgi:hypothetical protein
MSSFTSTSDQATHCEHCDRKLNPKRITWLELNFVTNRYTDQPVPEDESQGCFAFGSACARTVLKNGGMW